MSELAKRLHGESCGCHRCVGARPGNQLARKHGAYRADIVVAAEPRTEEYLDWIRETRPIGAPCDEMCELRLAIVYWRSEQAVAAITEADEAVGDRPIASYAGGKTWLPQLRADLDRWMARATSLERELAVRRQAGRNSESI